MSVEEYSQDMAKVINSTEISTHVHTGGSGYDYLMSLLENKTREYTFMAFDDFRISMGRDEWGKKIFFETMGIMKILCPKPKGYRVINPLKPNIDKGKDIGYISSSAYIPCIEGAVEYPGLFVYDHKTLSWGFNGKKLNLIDDSFIEKMRDVADDLSEMYQEEKRIQGQLSRLKKKREKLRGE